MPVGCSGQPCDLVAGYASVDSSGHRYRRLVPGIDVRAGVTRGVSLGWSDLRVLRPGDAAVEAPGDAAPIPTGLARRWRGDDGMWHAIGLFALPRPRGGRAFVHHVRLAGSLLTDAGEAGVELGFASVTRVRVPLDSDEIHWIHYRSRSLAESQYRMLRESGDESE